ncbi:hypothetical protein ACL9RL_14540 [Plantibacter sp. Mn2098]|uniref:hypothetical protein n=1 Tax=Plantibacter sp. Mn2098 TaxID=3395266 RepID=UPI003BDC3056
MTSNTAQNQPTLSSGGSGSPRGAQPVVSGAPPQPGRRSALVSGVRRIAVIAIIVSLSLTALVGILVLVTGGFGEVQGRVLLTALLVAGFSITALCDLAIAGRSLRIVSAVGLVVSGIALVLGVVLIWRDWSDPFWSDALRWFAIAGVWAVSIAQVSLLLLLAGRRRRSIRIGLGVTIVVIVIVAVFVTLPILTNGDVPGSAAADYWRVFGVFVIIDALGTIVVPVLALFLRDAAGDSPDGGDAQAPIHGADAAGTTGTTGTAFATVPGTDPVAGGHARTITIVLTAEDDARLTSVALEADTTRERVAEYAITAHLDEVSPPRGPGGEAAAR